MLLGPSEHAGNILAKEQARRDEGVGGPGRRVEVRALPWIAALDAGPVVTRALPLGLGPREGDVGAEEVGQLTTARTPPTSLPASSTCETSAGNGAPTFGGSRVMMPAGHRGP